MFTFNICLAVLLSVALLLSEKKLQAEADECSSNSGCSGYNKYCCKQRYWYQSSVCRSGGCVGQSCSSNSDCGGLFEKCCSSTHLCAASPCPECSSNLGCGLNKYCCKQEYSWQTNVCGSGGCVGQSCSSNSDCGGIGECCLNNVCEDSGCDECSSNSDCGYNKYCCKQRYSLQNHVCGSGGCVGQSCSSDSDCGGIGECCLNNFCKDSGCYDDVAKALASWVIGVIVVSVLVAVVIPIAIIACCCCGVASASRGRAQRGVVITQPTNSATVVALQNTQTVQNNPAQFQSSPYPPPPAYPNQGQNVPPAQFQTQVPPPAYKY